MRLVHLPMTDAWVFASAEITVPVAGVYVHRTREEAVSRAQEAGFVVRDDNTVVAAR
jgi:hypothetical protein